MREQVFIFASSTDQQVFQCAMRKDARIQENNVYDTNVLFLLTFKINFMPNDAFSVKLQRVY